ncbi:MAG TPA: PKD domain-containing protein [Tepidisphaeraceae bacterium]|nr:PKD domain-containing protein [Tepidisphaeraceae bacterium]
MVLFAIVFCSVSAARGATGWFDASFRRAIDVTWDAEHASGSEICYVEFYTAGHLLPDGADVRVAMDDGRQVAAKVLMVGPGDRTSIIFSLAKGVKKYFVYFGAANPSPNKPAYETVKIDAGLLLDMHEWKGTPVDTSEQIEQAWAKAGPLIGRTMIDSPFYGINPFGQQNRTISRITGSLFAPLDGNYTFAAFVENRGALYIDGKKVLYVKPGPADVSQQAKINLTRGRHQFLFYHVNAGSEGRFTVAWMRPDTKGFEPIPRGSFGIFSRGTAGPMDETHKPLVADVTIQYGGECYYAEAYSHRYVFAAREPKFSAKASFEWNFGDGQTSTAQDADHVYLTDGVYPVTLTVRVGATSDSQTNKLAVSRDWAHIDKPAGDEPSVQSKIVGNYSVAKMPEDWLPRATWLHERAGQTRWMLQCADRLASLSKHPNADQAFAALQGASDATVAKGDSASALKLWEQVVSASDLEPRAAAAYAKLLLWQSPDFARAVKVLTPYGAAANSGLARIYADALVLNQRAAEGRKILESIPVNEQPGRAAAKSGALARTIEYYIEQKDWETGEQRWDQWQDQFPADFLEGYSVVLKVKLMELRGVPQSAAKVAEAFATAVPGSSYSPQLLFKAAKLMETSGPGHSAELMKLLKMRYPEDPLAQ